MIFKETNLDGVFEIENKKFIDERGAFIKTFHFDTFKEKGLEANFKESFYSYFSNSFFVFFRCFICLFP